jgi:membrane protein implicated in regulation of membrane protease activity
MSTNIGWIWIVLAAVFFVGEIFSAAFFLLWFGIGAAVAGVLALLGVGFGVQLVVFIVVSFVLFIASRRFADRFTKTQPPGIGADRFTGQPCVVLVEIDNAANTGRVRMEQEEWRAESATGEVLPAGTRVLVAGTNGTRLVVKKITEGV